MKPSPNNLPRIGLAADRQACFSCAETEARLEMAVANYLRAIQRVEELQATIGRMANREAVHYERRAVHGPSNRYTEPDPVKG